MEHLQCWLKQSYSKTPTEGPEAKRVKFSDIHETLQQNFPSHKISTQVCRAVVEEAFPDAKRIRVGKQRLRYVVGIEQSHPCTDSIEGLKADNIQLRATVNQLEERIRELEAQISTSPAYSPLLTQQMDSLLRHGDQILHGPNTPARFSEFSVKALTAEIETNAPDVYQLFLKLGDTDRNLTCGSDTPVEKRKAIMSLCTLLNARSRSANGLQLLLSFMLIARATSKQARTYIMYYTCTLYMYCLACGGTY